MRAKTTITLNEDEVATVHELRIRDLRDLIAVIQPLFDHDGEPDLRDIFSDQHWPDISECLRHIIKLPVGWGLEDLSLSEIDLIKNAFLELHPDFFAHLLPGKAAPTRNASSSASAGSSPSVDMPRPGNMASPTPAP